MPNYTLFFGFDPTGVYAVLNNNYTPAARQYFHNVTGPLLFNQDIMLKSLIDNLTATVNTLKNVSTTTINQTDIYYANTHPLTYLCWIWTLLTLLVCMGWGVWKLVTHIRISPESVHESAEIQKKSQILNNSSITELA
jgi:hypothetical protein